MLSEKGEKMNPWKSKKHKNIYKDVNVRKGISLRFEKEVHEDVKNLFKRFTDWLRANYDFPIRVTIYVKASETITLQNGCIAWGSFRYFDTLQFYTILKSIFTYSFNCSWDIYLS